MNLNKITTRSTLLLVFTTLLFSAPAFSKPDKTGKDHPLISRYAKSHIIKHYVTNYDEYEFAMGKSISPVKRPPMKTIEGKITTITYEANNKGESVLQIYRNFEMAFRRAGFVTNYKCKMAACGPKFIPKLLGDSKRKGKYLGIDPWNTVKRSADFRFWNGYIRKNKKTFYVTLLVRNHIVGSWPTKILLEIVETKAMPTGMVRINMGMLERSIRNQGKARLDGIYFDTDKAAIKPRSKSALGTIARFLKKNRAMKVFIVGHTDNRGTFKHNMSLSQRRAAAVVTALIKEFGINASRLQPMGAGQTSPVTSNASESGRARNRRVIMVLR